ncbi:MAG TPA: DUF6152 family protein [Gammaproteobacteria bacterium]|nr:DUF6152 family protein [Gammaproteobacteria bacterium]
MKHPILIAPLVAVTALLCTPARAHHSMAMYDMSKVEVIEGTIAKLDWMNPHMYLTVETKGPDGKPALIEGEGLGITQANVDGLKREDLKPGTPVVVRVNPNRSGWGKQVRVLDVTTQDGEIHPFYAANTRTRVLTPATSIAGHWAPNRAATGAAFGAMAAFPLNADAKAAQAKALGDGLCYVEPIPFGAVLDELRTIDVGKNEVVMRFDNTGDHYERIVQLTDKHPADVKPTQQGHSIGRWDGDTLVVDTIAFTPDRSGLGASVPSGPAKHTVERFTLSPDKVHLRYEITVEDPMYLTGPAKLAQQWEHRPDLELSQDTGACDAKARDKYKEAF